MLQVVREYPVFILRLAPDNGFAMNHAVVLVSAEGPFVDENGADAVFELLNSKIHEYICRHWRMRWFVSTESELSFAKQCGIRTTLFAGGTGTTQLAEQLLHSVFPSMFEDRGLLVRACQVRIEGLDPGHAELSVDEAKAHHQAFGGTKKVPHSAASLEPYEAPPTKLGLTFGKGAAF